MKRIIYIDTGINKLLYPFRKWIKKVKYINVKKELVGLEQYVYYVKLLDKNNKEIEIPENEEIINMCKLWEEDCFADFLHNIIAENLMDNSENSNVTEQIYL